MAISVNLYTPTLNVSPGISVLPQKLLTKTNFGIRNTGDELRRIKILKLQKNKT